MFFEKIGIFFKNKIRIKYSFLAFFLAGFLFCFLFLVDKNRFLLWKASWDKGVPVFEVLCNWLKSSTVDVEKIFIEVEEKDFQKLKEKRDEAVSSGFLISSSNDYVSGILKVDEEEQKIKLRLKGDFVDHLESDNWSFRVKVSEMDLVWGMNRFSLHHPKSRNYIYEWIYQKMLSREGVISLPYFFVRLNLNGSDLGIYAVEGHFNDLLVEDAGRPWGPIIKLDEDLLWKERVVFGKENIDSEKSGYGIYTSAENVSFIDFEDPLLNEDKKGKIQDALGLLDSFRKGEKKTSQVFDARKLAIFMGLMDLAGSHHSFWWTNLRFYYNPITMKLEPIGFDGNSGEKITWLSPSFSEKQDPRHKNEVLFNDLFFQDEDFWTEYIKVLSRISKKEYLDVLFNGFSDDLNENLNILYKSYPDFKFSKEVFYENQDYIRNVLNPESIVRARLVELSEKNIVLEVGNLQLLPVEILRVSVESDVFDISQKKTVLDGKKFKDLVDYQRIDIDTLNGQFSANDQDFSLQIHISLLGLEEEIVLDVENKINTFDVESWKEKFNFIEFPFFSVDEELGTIEIKPGNWSIRKDVVVSDKYRLIAKKGVVLDLKNGAKIISFSPVKFTGTELDKIKVTSSDQTGGFYVVSALGKSSFENVVFSGLGSVFDETVSFDGSVGFYDSEVGFHNCLFLKNGSRELFLGIRNSTFEIQDTEFRDVFLNALRTDSSKGRMWKVGFFGLGQDASEFLNSEVEMGEVFYDGVDGKSLVLSHESTLEADLISVFGSGVGVCLSGSRASIKELGLFGVGTGLLISEGNQDGQYSVVEIKKLDGKLVETLFVKDENSFVRIESENIM